ncbi:MAG: FlgB family protein [Paracoccaceae bacterium]|nr:MAG: FlgB family protein [Paracoccaceae bacterium]
MFEKLKLTAMAQALAAHSGARTGVVAQNMAHADTPGYKARDVPEFAAVWHESADLRATRPGHLTGGAGARPAEPFADLRFGAPNGNTVSLEAEMVKAAEARQSHDMALAIYRSTSDIIRSALGRGR